jgi:hypothetical protein
MAHLDQTVLQAGDGAGGNQTRQMISRREFNGALAMLLALALAVSPAWALVSLNDGHDHAYVTGQVGYTWDSNIFANSEAKSDTSITASVIASYQRRAGWIGVDGSLELDGAQYNHFRSENFNNPKFNLELTKQTGRTTGSLTLAASRQSRADAAVNIRTTSWNYSTGLNFRYPIITVYTISGQLGYSFVKYGNNAFPELGTYTASVDMIRLLSTERDLTVGYRFRRGETSVDTSYDDHAVTAGLSGKLIRGINGSMRVGYQTRIPHGAVSVASAGTSKSSAKFSSWTASAATTYAFNKRLHFTGSLSKDFSTTANDISVDTTTAALDANYALTSHWQFSATASGGDSKFLGDAGRRLISLGPPPVLGPSRHDKFATMNASANYSLNEHLKIGATYTWFKNWSTESIADFVRSSYTLNVSSRW